jgi:hypothetical protein
MNISGVIAISNDRITKWLVCTLSSVKKYSAGMSEVTNNMPNIAPRKESELAMVRDA